MTDHSLAKLAREGLVLALRTKMNPSLPIRLREEVSERVDLYKNILDRLSHGGCHG